MKIFKRIMLSIVSVLMLVIIVVGGYLEYVLLQFYRIEDKTTLEIVDKNSNALDISQSYTITTYNIGFGAYSQDYSFFMDDGHMADGTYVKGKYAKAKNKDAVLTNTNGAIETIKALNTDFAFFQEVDKKATRSYNVNQYQMILDEFADYDATYASNFHSAYLMYPFNDMIGKTEAGIVTLSKYNLDSSVRYSLPIDMGFPARLFDLDRCFSINRITLSNGKELVLINIHMSAYDEGGLIRKQQLEVLNAVLKSEREKGNYVITGGDFNHDIADPNEAYGSEKIFTSGQQRPSWVNSLVESDLAEGYHIATATNHPSCRSSDIPWEEGVNYSVVIDGFIVSDNVTVEATEVLSQGSELFLYSDHNPVKMTFRLN